jgi:hypothetical protein
MIIDQAWTISSAIADLTITGCMIAIVSSSPIPLTDF